MCRCLQCFAPRRAGSGLDWFKRLYCTSFCISFVVLPRFCFFSCWLLSQYCICSSIHVVVFWISCHPFCEARPTSSSRFWAAFAEYDSSFTPLCPIVRERHRKSHRAISLYIARDRVNRSSRWMQRSCCSANHIRFQRSSSSRPRPLSIFLHFHEICPV